MGWMLIPGIVFQVVGMALFALSMAQQRAVKGAALLAGSIIIYICGATLIFNSGASP